jgi:lactoylglutathione lyase
MPASLRLEIFPAEMRRCLDFYIGVLDFQMRLEKDNYAFINRGDIFIAAIAVPTDETLQEKAAYRRPPKGLELVFEVDDLVAERDRIVAHGVRLEDDIKKQEWGLEDFRLLDPDGYCEFCPAMPSPMWSRVIADEQLRSRDRPRTVATSKAP